mmetsp:Transcript_49794/g.143282  ORF Transcript_49794/g.143282 Transcript_49794/m.143282 type:complete len:274 (-) Transcript_49794:1497-2318(-)
MPMRCAGWTPPLRRAHCRSRMATECARHPGPPPVLTTGPGRQHPTQVRRMSGRDRSTMSTPSFGATYIPTAGRRPSASRCWQHNTRRSTSSSRMQPRRGLQGRSRELHYRCLSRSAPRGPQQRRPRGVIATPRRWRVARLRYRRRRELRHRRLRARCGIGISRLRLQTTTRSRRWRHLRRWRPGRRVRRRRSCSPCIQLERSCYRRRSCRPRCKLGRGTLLPHGPPRRSLPQEHSRATAHGGRRRSSSRSRHGEIRRLNPEQHGRRSSPHPRW